MVFRSVVGAVVLAVAFAGRSAAAPRIVNGTPTAGFPSVGALLAGDGPDSAGIICSGTLIGCQTFLTAAHCVCDTVGSDCQSGGPAVANPSGLFVFLEHAGVFGVDRIDVHPAFDFPVADVAVLHLATAVTGVRPTPLNTTAAPTPGMPGAIVGFGNSGALADYGLKRAGQVLSAACTPDISSVTSTCFDFEEPIGPPGTDSDTCNGDSGGPLFVDFGCGPNVAGLTSGGSNATCAALDHAYDANVFHYAATIAGWAGADLAAPACGSMPQAGEPGADVFAFTGRFDTVTTETSHTFTVAPGTTRLRVALNAVDDGASDFDLLVAPGSSATPPAFVCTREGSGQFGVCEVLAPAPGSWTAVVRRFRGTGDYQVTATVFAIGLPGPGVDGTPCDDENLCTGAGTCHAGQCTDLVPLSGIPCDDGSGCTAPDACAAGVCVGTPTVATDCRRATVPGKGMFQLKASPVGTRDQLAWKLSRGSATAVADFGSPQTTTTYDLCVFTIANGTTTLLAGARVPPGPVWRAFPSGFKYRDRTMAFGGLSSLDVRATSGGVATIAAKAKGEPFHVPSLPLASPAQVVVQLGNGTACWQGSFSTSLVNDGRQFKAKAD